jgi:hypothetical protein
LGEGVCWRPSEEDRLTLCGVTEMEPIRMVHDEKLYEGHWEGSVFVVTFWDGKPL